MLDALGATRISVGGLTLTAAGSTDAKQVHTAVISDLKAAGVTAQEV